MDSRQQPTYTSARREKQARQTKADILDAAQQLFTTLGYTTTTVAAIAEAAEVAQATVYAAFGSKRGLLEAVMNRTIAGDDQPVPIDDWPEFQAMLAEADPQQRIALAVALVCGINDRLSPLAEITAAVDPDVAALTRVHKDRRYQSVRLGVDAFATAGMLAAELAVEIATDIVWTLLSPEVYQLLVGDRGWTPQQYQHWLTHTLSLLLLDHDRLGHDRQG